MNAITKTLITVGIVLILLGLFWQIGSKWFPLGRLPGDIRIEKGNVQFYFPIVTCIVVSLLFAFISYVIRLFR
ncbi:DUF2905 domain-containing protein [Hazenella sp. IB182357]|uniref:DUF2905 domain-containing protein n=1 Tax=Polycladospora coralii TaxID=2771432 RepID=A0A926RWP6_9BACL|nr:DUF2905 domain-containing protein [Polycladospora coralii]MBD1371731.1 DUF2905 domain-containing protein [Polycladospora coralii]MBS7529198.1 DUF2905 domain-containing protein [Polycladospora coralii]